MIKSSRALLFVGSASLVLSACSQLNEVEPVIRAQQPVINTTSTVTVPTLQTQQVVPTFQPRTVNVQPVQVAAAPIQQVQPFQVTQQFQATQPIQQITRPTQVANASASTGPFGISGPPNPRPGECYARVTIPAKTESYTDRVVAEPESTQTRIVPAKYGEVTETIVVKEATEQLRVIPATYRTVTESVVVRPAARQVIPVDPTYDTVEERVLVTPERQVWKKGRGPIERLDSSGEILCLVTEPAVYRTVKKRVLVQPGTTRTKIIPAVTNQVSKQVVAQPSRVEKQIVPAVTKEIKKRVIIEPARQEVVRVPAKFKSLNKTRTITPTQTVWKSILCETNTTPGIIRRLQAALRDRGFNPGRIDGVLGRQTQSAVDRYQRSLGMQTNGITIDTLTSLGVTR